MKKPSVAMLLILLSSICHAANDSATSLVTSGLEAYKEKGASETLKIWVKNSGLEGSDVVSAQTEVFTKLEAFFGKFENYEISKVYNLSKRSEVVFFVMNYEKGLTFAYLQAYETRDGDWIATEFLTNTNATKIWPSQMFDAQ